MLAASSLDGGIPELKKLVKDAGVQANCQQNNNPSMRQALYAATHELELRETDVPLNEADAKNIWEAIRRNLPIYALFRSDRSSNDQDPEVQNPMKLAVQKALANLTGDLEEITKKVEEVAEETALRTIEQLKSSYPDIELASVLKPQFRRPNWNSVFKLDLESDDGIPLNKRGSGVRRLVLLSFFQAEAARTREKKAGDGGTRVPVIYAIEEPETSQHPDHQERIVRAFCEIAGSGDQALITTHVPGLAGLLPIESLRFIDSDPESGAPRVRAGSSEMLSEVANALGVLPDPLREPGVQVAVAVEGFTDIDALFSFADVLTAAGELDGFDESRVFWTIGGGSTLKDWVERKYLDSLNIPQVYIFDSDQTSAALPPSVAKREQVDELNRRPNCRAFLTKKRTIENYMHPAALARVSNGQLMLPDNIDLDFGNISEAYGAALRAAKTAHGGNLAFAPTNRAGERLRVGAGASKSKKVICGYVMRNMTPEEVSARAYVLLW